MKEHIQRLLHNKWALPVATGVAGFAAGVVVGYMRTRSQYNELEAMLTELKEDQLEFDDVTSDIEEAKRRIDQLVINPSHAHAVDLTVEPLPELEEKRSATRSQRVKVDLSPLEDVREVGKAVVSNIFSRSTSNNDGDEWDYKTEIEARDPTQPYVIHVDEYVADEMGWESQSTCTWYEKDQILCDSHDKPIYNHSEVVGELRFGHGSNDANVVYIRNEKLQHEFEILRDEGSYEEIVLGEQMERKGREDELKHSHQLRFRQE
jgi:hypothetical protein